MNDLVTNSSIDESIGDKSATRTLTQQRDYPALEIVVDRGVLVDRELFPKKEYAYSKVPFGLILEGTLTVYEEGIGVRELRTGDCIGGFETAYWLRTGLSNRIGRWSVQTDSKVSILFFSRKTFERFHSGAKSAEQIILKAASNDHVPQPISSLPLLDWTAAHLDTTLYDDTAVIIHSHILPTNVELMRIISHQFGYRNLFILEKPYSTVRSAYEKLNDSGVNIIPMPFRPGDDYRTALLRSISVLEEKLIKAASQRRLKRALIYDDGGFVLSTLVPRLRNSFDQVAGVEQTASGLAHVAPLAQSLCPIVSVASSGVKKEVESYYIADAVFRKLKSAGYFDQVDKIGILGMGSIGQMVFDSVRCLGKDVFCYDRTQPKGVLESEFRRSVPALLQQVDLVVGCTGLNALQGVTLGDIRGEIRAFSASSSDIEFYRLINSSEALESVFEERVVRPHKDLVFRVGNGGFPVNFDREREWEHPHDIVLTRCLIKIGISQAIALLNNPLASSQVYLLDQRSQERVLTEWLSLKDILKEPVDPRFRKTSEIAYRNVIPGLTQGPSCWNELNITFDSEAEFPDLVFLPDHHQSV